MLRCEIGKSHEADREIRRTANDGMDLQETLHEIRHRGRFRCGGQPERVIPLPGIPVHRDIIPRHAVERVSGGGDFLRNRE